MSLHVPNRLGRWAVVAAVATAVAAQSLAAAAPAFAGTAKSPAYFDRAAVVKRAKTWVDRRVPYSQTGWRDAYRTDCSGFISMAWGLDQSYVTWSLPEISRRIAKDDLQPGDVLLSPRKHVVMFVKWNDRKRTSYVGYEQAGTPHRAVARVIRYPYGTGRSSGAYKPYRYVGGHNLKAPGNEAPAPFIQTYAGGRSVYVPGARAKSTNVKTWRVTQKRLAVKKAAAKAVAAKKKAEAEKVRQAAAAKKAAAAKAAEARARAAAQDAAKPPAMKLLQGIVALLAN